MPRLACSTSCAAWGITLALFALGVLSPLSAAQSRKLNGQLVQPFPANARSDFLYSPDGSRVLFLADKEIAFAFELYSAPANGAGPTIRLSADPRDSRVGEFRVTPEFAVYFASDPVGVTELFSVPLGGGAAPVRLSDELVEGGDVSWFEPTPDGQCVVFLADARVDGQREFFLAPVDGSAPAALLAESSPQAPIQEAWIHPSGTHLVFTRRDPSLFRGQLLAVPLDGGEPTLLALSVPSTTYGTTEIRSVSFSAGGSLVVYQDYEESGDGQPFIRLFAVPLDSSMPPRLLSGVPVLVCPSYALSPVAERLLYFEFSRGLFSVALDGTGRVRLDSDELPLLFFASGPLFTFTPDGEHVVYRANRADGIALMRAPAGGGAAPDVLAEGLVSRFQVSGTRVFFSVTDETSFTGLFSVPIDGAAAPTLLNGPPSPSAGVEASSFAPTPEGEVLFRQRPESGSLTELHLAPGDGGGPTGRISAVGVGSIGSFRLSPDGERIAYLARDHGFELFGTTVGGDALEDPFLSLGAGPIRGDVLDFRVSPDGKRIVYRADEVTDRVPELFLADRRGPLAPLPFSQDVRPDFRISPSGERVVQRLESGALTSASIEPTGAGAVLESGITEQAFGITADGRWVVYVEDLRPRPVLVSRRADGSGPPIRLANRAPVDFKLSPDSQTVVYRRGGLFRVQVDGSEAPVRLNPSGAVGPYRVSADSAYVVFASNPRSVEEFELFSVPLRGTRPPVRISGELALGGDVVDFRLSGDGRRVVYRAAAPTPGGLNLFGVPVAGRGGPVGPVVGPEVVQLTFVTGAQVIEPDYLLTPDNGQVLFRTAAVTGEHELHRVGVRGGAPPVRLSAPLSPGGRVLSFEVTPDSRRVVYLAARDASDVHELFGVTTYGGPIVPIDPLPPFADVLAYHVSPDSQTVVYACDRSADGLVELWAAPLDGSEAPVRVNDPLPPGGSVQLDFVPLEGRRVIYRADQEVDEVYELFLGHAPSRRRF